MRDEVTQSVSNATRAVEVSVSTVGLVTSTRGRIPIAGKWSVFSLCYANPAGSFKRGYPSWISVGMQSGCSIDNALGCSRTFHSHHIRFKNPNLCVHHLIQFQKPADTAADSMFSVLLKPLGSGELGRGWHHATFGSQPPFRPLPWQGGGGLRPQL